MLQINKGKQVQKESGSDFPRTVRPAPRLEPVPFAQQNNNLPCRCHSFKLVYLSRGVFN